MCGEKSVLAVWLVPLKGSPPHVRGKVARIDKQAVCRGITPACAGKRIHRHLDGVDQDHPRMCGEKGLTYYGHLNDPGSPPHVRGKVITIRVLISEVGITPACAGKREQFRMKKLSTRDHPRMCGEKTKKIP